MTHVFDITIPSPALSKANYGCSQRREFRHNLVRRPMP
jgi:hypothetical protein